MKNNLEQLKGKRDKLVRQINDIEYKKLVEVSVPKLKKMVGQCFKYHNSYGVNHDRWWLYCKVKEVNEKTMEFTTVEFQRTSMEAIEVKLDRKFNFNGENFFDRMGGYIAITNSEYNRAKKSLKKFILNNLA